MFKNCTGLKTLNLSSWDISGAYYTNEKGATVNNLFELSTCSKLTKLYTPATNSSQSISLPATFANVTDKDMENFYDSFNSEDFSTSKELVRTTNYIVSYWTQNIGGKTNLQDENNYTLNKLDILTYAMDEEVTPTPISINGYTTPEAKTVTLQEDGSSIINYYYTLDAQFTITIPKEIEIGQDKQAQYDISVSGSVPYETQLNIEPVDNVNNVDGINFYMVEKEGKQAIVNISQNDVDWKYNEINDENGTIKSGTINADNLDAGEWEGSFSFGINSHKHEFKETIEGDICAEKGTINYACQDCDYSYSKEVEALGHDWQEDNSCSRCDLVAQPFTLTKSNMYMTGLVSQTYGDYDNIDELSGDIVIPETFEYDGVTYRISSIGDAAFYNCSNITSIKIPNSVTTIGEVAFYKDYNLSGDLVFSDNVTNIEYGAFAATNLSSVTLGINVESIGEYAFYNCKNLSGNLIIHDKVTNIGAYAFANCYSLTNLKIGNSVTTIGIGAFQSCLGLSGDLVIPNNVIDICELAFYDCENLTSLTLGNRVENIKYGAFGYCINLSGTLTLPDNVTTLGGYAFYYCESLTGLVLNENLTSIGNNAFYYCDGLTGNLTIPSNVTKIGTNAFVFDLNNLTNIVVEEGNQYYDSRDNCNAIIETSSNKLILGCQNTVISDSVTSIGAYAFSGCTLSGDLVISSNITSIGNYAFRLRNNDLNSIVVDANNTKYNSNNNCNAII
jgi:surface protein